MAEKKIPRSEEVSRRGAPKRKADSGKMRSRNKKAVSRKMEASRAKKNSKNKKPIRFLRRMKKKLFIEVGMVMLLLGFLIGRLTYIQLVNGKEYEKQVLSQQGYSSQTLPYQRGSILDTKGTVLANSVDIYNLVLDCKQINEVTNKKKKERKYIDPTVKAIVECFPDVKEEEVRAAQIGRAHV